MRQKKKEKRVLFLTSHSIDLLQKKLSLSGNSFQTTYFVSSCFSFCIWHSLYQPFAYFNLVLYLLFHSSSVCLRLFLSISVPLLGSMYFLSLLSALCSVQFLVSFANVSIHFYWLSSFAWCESRTTVILFTPPVGGVWLGSYLISVICTCIPQGSTAWMSLKDLHVYLTVLVYILIKDVSFSAYQWVQFRTTHMSCFSVLHRCWWYQHVICCRVT